MSVLKGKSNECLEFIRFIENMEGGVKEYKRMINGKR